MAPSWDLPPGHRLPKPLVAEGARTRLTAGRSRQASGQCVETLQSEPLMAEL